MSHFRKSCNAGFSLVEAAIVLGVVGLIIGGIWAASNSVAQNRQTNQLAAGTLVMVNNIRRVFADSFPTASTVLGSEVNTLGLAAGADGFTYDATVGNIRDMLGHNIWVDFNYTRPGGDWPIQIWFENIDAATCIRLTAECTGTGQWLGFYFKR